jgi:hypothetical protein
MVCVILLALFVLGLLLSTLAPRDAYDDMR